jgi:hypothetical protein
MIDQDFASPAPSDSHWDDLVISILAVNRYSLEKTYDRKSGLQEQKITDPRSLVNWTEEEIERRLKASGYDRGLFMTKLFARRLFALAGLIRAVGLTHCNQVLSGRSKGEIEYLLERVNGVGPIVLQNFYILRQI